MDNAAKIAFLQRIPLLQTLTEEEMSRLAASSQFVFRRKYRFIYKPGEPAEHIYFLYSGRIKLGTYSDDQREIIKELLRADSVLGESVLLGERTRTEFAQVLSESAEYLMVRCSDFAFLMHTNPRLMLCCLQHLSDRIKRIESRLAQMILKDARERVIQFLVEVAGKEGMQIGYETLVRDFFPQQEIANITGTSRQTVTAVLNELRKSNLIHFDRHSILFRDVSKLA
ncbi:MAG: Crp/Fnr family transcriptional regulator [Saprospiraceae bacterium]|nr:Crp/Fnr family transcriptional regulator [Saprospiraceae bacterium]MDW8228423.1 Crp/Fnr family transcriptional regulator [Saprospiraceae bacterium]